MKTNKKFYKLIFLLGSIFILLSCIDTTFFNGLDNQIATLSAVEQQMNTLVTPVSNFSAKPGEKSGEVVFQWEHPMGEDLSYSLYINDQPINQENWESLTPIELNSRDIDFSNQSGTVKMTYTWDRMPLRAKKWFVVRQSIKALENLDTAMEILEGVFDSEIPDNILEIPPSLLQPSNMVSIIDTGFRPDPDGYKRQNQSAFMFLPPVTASNYFDMLRSIYGNDQICVRVILGKCIPRKTTLKIFKEYYFGGHCYGFSVSSGLIFLDKLDINQYTGFRLGGSPQTIDLGSTAKVNNLIMTYQILQMQDEMNNQRTSSSNLTATAFYSLLERTLINNSALANIDIYHTNGDKCGAHAILPYFLIFSDEEFHKAWVYDSNHPKSLSQILTFDFSENSWKYNFSNTSTWSGSYGDPNEGCDEIKLEDINSFKDYKTGYYVNKASWIEVASERLVLVGGTIKIAISNSFGKAIGYDPVNNFRNNIAEASYHILNEDGLQLFILPIDDYNFSIINSGDSAQSVLFLGSSEAISFTNLSPGDNFAITTNNIIVSNQQNLSTSEISVIVEQDNQSSKFSVKPRLSPGENIEINYDPEDLVFTVSSSETLDIGLDIAISNSEEDINFQQNAVPINPGEDFIVNPEDETLSDSTYYLGVDTNQDGELDEIRPLDNEFEPNAEEQPSHEHRRSPWLIILSIGGGVIVITIIILFIISKTKRKKHNPYDDFNDYDDYFNL